MTQVKIRLQQVDQVKDFVNLLSRYPYEIDLVSGRYTIDAKSLLGIYSLDLSNPLTLVIYSRTAASCSNSFTPFCPSAKFKPIDIFYFISSLFAPPRCRKLRRGGGGLGRFKTQGFATGCRTLRHKL